MLLRIPGASLLRMETRTQGSHQSKLSREATGPLLACCLAVAIEVLAGTPFKILNAPAFFVVLVAFAALRGGLRSGLTSALIASGYLAFYFSLPDHPFRYGQNDLRQVIVWFGALPAIAIMIGKQQQRIEQAERARYDTVYQGSLRRYAERLELLHKIDQSILSAKSPEAIADAALDEIWRLIPYQRATIGLFDFEAKTYSVLATHAVGTNPLVAQTLIPLADLGNVDAMLTALQQGDVYQQDLSALSASSPVIQAVVSQGAYHANVVPLIAQGTLIGCMALSADVSRALAPEHLEVAREVADELAVAIQQARLREGLRRHTADLEHRVASRTAELQKASQDAAQATQAKTEFLSRMSHELRTPLNAILGFAQLLEMDSLTPEQEESVAHIVKGGRHLLDLINEVLDIARIEEGRLALSIEPVSLRDVVNESLDLIKPMARDAKILIDAAPASGFIVADRQRLKQVLLNLLSNAVKYNRPRGTVTLFFDKKRAGRVRIKVSDTGPGIAADRLPKLYLPFERLGAEQAGVEGTGLGLALSKRLVDAMGGTMGVESLPDEGCTFWVDLALAESPTHRLEEAGTIVPVAADLSPTSEVRIILYIEDNLSNLKLVQRLMVHRPEVRLIPAMQGRMGLDLARKHHPDLIFLDLHLPDMPGEQVLRRLQADPETRPIPVVIVSADAMPNQVERLRVAGAVDYLTKPLEVKKFLKVLDDLLADRAGSTRADDKVGKP